MGMTNEEARKIAQGLITDFKCDSDTMVDFCNTVIKALEQQTCEDCISREETLNKINELIAEYIPLMPTGWTLPLNIAKTINEMPSVTPQQTRWIPVSERLPKACEFVNCTCHSLIDDREDWVIETVYIPQPSDSPYSDWGNIPMLNSGDCEVVAWIHRDIPEPYKAEKEENVRKDCYYNDGEVHAECVICGKAESEVNNDDNN